jgi:hypothetical protein
VGVTKVVFYINGVLDKTFTSAPYSYVVPSTVADNGVYTLTAKAYDAAGNVGQSAPITITVNNPVSDTTAPTASITSPSAKASVSGTVNVAANATDNVGIAKVEFYVNGALAAADTSAPYSFTWDTTAVANGSCTLLVKAYDAAGNVGQSSATTVTVNNPIADTILPTAAITSPAAGASVSGTVTITASASDNVGVSKVEFYVNGALKSTASSAPFTSVWDTTQTANGTGTLVVKAYDAAGNIGTSAPVTITVNNSASGTVSDSTAPTVSITAPTSTFVSGSNVTISATATDSAGVARTELYIDGKLVNQSNGGAAKWSWNTTSYARGSHVIMVKAYDASNNAGSSSKSVYKYR